MPTPRAATTVRKTPNFDFIFGRYSHSRSVIPYFQVAMSFNDVAQYLKLINEMPGAASMNWKVEELFQRDIDWWRVERKIVPYLKQQQEPQFFNSLTIALLPIRREVIGTYSDGQTWNAPPLDGQDQFGQGKVCTFGPITCGYWNSWSDPSDDSARLGQLCWNTEEICAVAIDGQHRLAAIKQLAGPGGEAYRDSSVPVILVVLDPELGFGAGSSRESLIDVLRRLFIDLNKHAQKVNRARQILLDDRDPASICVRSLVGPALTTGEHELEADPPALPLSLVDWHSEQAKFDEGPYLTTILGTDWAIARILGIKPFEDPMAFDDIDRLIGRLKRQLEIELPEARQRLDECRRFERPFSFVEEPVNELQRIGEGFRQRWATPVIQLLTRLSPYQELTRLRGSRGTLTPEFANWFALREGAGSAGRAAQLLGEYERHLTNRDNDPIAIGDYTDALDAFRDLKINRQLAFTVVFQRALIFAFLQFTKISRRMTDNLGQVEEIDLDEALDAENDESNEGADIHGIEEARAEELIDALNHLISEEPEILKVDFEFPWEDDASKFDRFWLASFVQPAGPIDFTQSASKRASDLLLLAGLFWLYRREEILSHHDFDDLMERIDDAESGLDLKLHQCLGRLWVGDQTIAGKILRSRDIDPSENEELAWEEIQRRAKWLWARIMSS